MGLTVLFAGLRAQEVWTAATGTSSQNLWSVCYGGGQFVAVGENGTILTSPDGSVWTQRVSGSTVWLVSVAYGKGQFVVVGDKATILTSSDGVTWTLRNNVGTRINAVTFGNGMFLAGDEGDGVWMSTDGISWTSRGGSLYWGGDYPQLRGLTYAAPLFVMTGARGYIATTFDGGDFTTRSTSISGFVESVAYGRHLFVAGGEGGITFTSTDSINWIPRNSASSYLRGIIFFNNQFVGVGDSGVISTSFDGSAWTPRVSGTSQLLTAIAANDSAAIAVGFGGTILRSAVAQHAPAVANQPVAITEAVGGSVAFSVSASGSMPLAYQWRKDGSLIAGATTDTLFFSAITAANAGNYSCVITNSLGQTTSNNATLTVVPSFPANQAGSVPVVVKS